MRVGGQGRAPSTLTPGMNRYPLFERVGGPGGRSGIVRKFVPPLRFDPQTVQPIASAYID